MPGTKSAAVNYICGCELAARRAQAAGPERNVRLGVKTLISAAQAFCRSPLLPAAAVMLIAIFTVSLALAEPHSESLRLSGNQVLGNQVLAVRGDDVATIDGLTNGRPLADDSLTDEEAAIFSAPSTAPHDHDRYRFYHRYDLNSPRSRFNSPDDGIN
jgi:hypothetical protein